MEHPFLPPPHPQPELPPVYSSSAILFDNSRERFFFSLNNIRSFIDCVVGLLRPSISTAEATSGMYVFASDYCMSV